MILLPLPPVKTGERGNERPRRSERAGEARRASPAYVLGVVLLREALALSPDSFKREAEPAVRQLETLAGGLFAVVRDRLAEAEPPEEMN